MSKVYKTNSISFVLNTDLTQKLTSKQDNLTDSTLLFGIGSNITYVNYNTLSNLPDLSIYVKKSTLVQNINSYYQDTSNIIDRNDIYINNTSNNYLITTSNLGFNNYVLSNTIPLNIPFSPFTSIISNYSLINHTFANCLPLNVGYMSLNFNNFSYQVYVSTSHFNINSSNHSMLFDGSLNTICLWGLNQYTNGNYSSVTNSSINGINGDWIIIKYPFLFLLSGFTFYSSSSMSGSPSTWSCFGSLDGVNFILIPQASNQTPKSSYLNFGTTLNSFNTPYYYIAILVSSLTNNSQILSLSKFW